MSGSVNKVIIIGNVGRDPEIRALNSGDRVANLSVATSETWKDKSSGERKEKTEWHRVVIFNDHIVKVVEQYVKRATRFTSKGRCRPGNGPIRAASRSIRRKSSCRSSRAN